MQEDYGLGVGKMCPLSHLCDNEKCRIIQKCIDSTFWSHYWRKKMSEKEAELGITKAERRRMAKKEKKAKGKTQYKREIRAAIVKHIFAHIDPCVKKEGCCDKQKACDILGECIVSMERFKSNSELIDSLRGPLNLKEILRILTKHDPLKSYSSGKK